MTEYQFLNEFLLVLVIATVIAISFERFRLPGILGFLTAGVVIGPYGLRILSNFERIRQLAELGVVLLMLTIGLEFSFDRFKGFKRIAILGGSLQILLSIGVALGFAWLRGWTPYEGFFLGSVIALSSTAIVLKYLIDRGELDTNHGRIAISILIFQDLAVVPLMIFVTNFGNASGSIVRPLIWAFLKTTLLLTAVIGFSRFILSRLLHRIAMARNREIFFLSSVVICLGTAWLSGQLGLSLATGAFFAGFMFANTEFGPQLIGEIIPFRYLFVSIFFVSIGLLFDIRFTMDNILMITSVVGLVLLVNFVLMTFLIMAFGFPPRIAMATGIILSQIGEFSFLLIEAAKKTGGINAYLYQVLLSTAFLTMLITPLLFSLVPWVLRISERLPIFGKTLLGGKKFSNLAYALKDHVILCGFGPSGRDLAQTFLEEKIPFVLLEMNPVKVTQIRKANMNVIYGDAANEEVLRRAGILEARAVVVSFADSIGIVQIIRVVERMNPEVVLAVRTRYETEMPRLYDLGADIVIMEEWEASYELNQVILEHFNIPKDRIEHHLDRIRTRKELAIEEAILKNAAKN